VRLRAGRRELELGGPPLLMGVVNATPDSFSDAGEFSDLPARAAELVAAGAAIVDVGGESAVGGRRPVEADEEIARVVPVIERIVAEHDVLVSVDTYKPEVAEAAIGAGAGMVNDVSGLRDERLAELCTRTGAALILMHTRVAPMGTLLEPDAYDDVVADVVGFLTERMEAAVAAGVGEDQIVLDPGPDFAKTPAQTVAVLRRLDALAALGRPLLLAVSRKDFLGAITGRGPRERGAATLAAVEFGVRSGASILRVHDVAAAADFLAVRAVLEGERELAPDEGLTPERYP
jgi:dihydropteroate synthase